VFRHARRVNKGAIYVESQRDLHTFQEPIADAEFSDWVRTSTC
jgi:hypothetical protein